nr:hypothetical protein BaRGS_029721 [Batillaria attramentaria]
MLTMQLLNCIPEDMQKIFRYLPFSKSPGWDMVDAHFHIDRLAQKFHLRKGVDEVLRKAPQPPADVKGILSEAIANFCDSQEYKSIPRWLEEQAGVTLYATVGLHPKEAARLSLSEADQHITSMVEFQKHARVVGVGEVMRKRFKITWE